METPSLQVESLKPQTTVTNNGDSGFLLREVRRLEAELEEAWRVLRLAWQNERPPDILEKRPYRSDVKVACRACGRLTSWRAGKGWAQCFPACHVTREVAKTTANIPPEVWKILLDEEVE